MKVISLPRVQKGVSSVSLYVGVGSLFEDEKLSGISHFLEHMLFRGCEDYPDYNAFGIALDQLGTYISALTSVRYTRFSFDAAARVAEQALSLLLGMVFKPLLKDEDVEAERKVVLEEISTRNDDRYRIGQDVARKALFGRGPLSRPVIGSRKAVSSLNGSAIRAHHRKFYRPENTILIAEGFSSEVIRKVLARFGVVESDCGCAVPEPSVATLAKVEQVVFRSKQLESLTLTLGGVAGGGRDKMDVLDVFYTLTTGMETSFGYSTLSNREGLVYYSDSWARDLTNASIFWWQNDLTERKIKRFAGEMVEFIKSLKRGTIDESLFERARANIVNALPLDTVSGALRNSVGLEQLLYGKYDADPKSIAKRIRVIKTEDIAELASEVFGKNLALSIVGDVKPKTKKLLRDFVVELRS
jgi:predicted Zn-dependent peptidase